MFHPGLVNPQKVWSVRWSDSLCPAHLKHEEIEQRVPAINKAGTPC
ncbi:hypothetical protein Plim_3894 [Planctopirus limnophila DSM 3776]|uniref:Uncharacterized protein n=1 Tax=Planctopirus limnophila (strain ATCC 43296 / DSM 3776 / IFAM 1008 / Mu 290) TaxID=521674 RepID=D5SX83_PLAL2|nr:hypothetical protein Plim_3894 [Planctopirus limnophila DSM 3776]